MGEKGIIKKLCWGYEDEDWKIVVRLNGPVLYGLDAPVRFSKNLFALRSYARNVLVIYFFSHAKALKGRFGGVGWVFICCSEADFDCS